jgi:transcriptional regulator with XRE-family HTH domain
MDLSGFQNLLDRAFLEYRIRQTRQRLSVSLNSFAGFLDFSPPIVNLWLNGNRVPSQGNVERLIPKLVELLDLEVYNILGLPRPDQNLQRLTRVWTQIPARFQQILAEQAEKYAVEGDKETVNGAVNVAKGDKELAKEIVNIAVSEKETARNMVDVVEGESEVTKAGKDTDEGEKDTTKEDRGTV